jgi:hypothetical protein
MKFRLRRLTKPVAQTPRYEQLEIKTWQCLIYIIQNDGLEEIHRLPVAVETNSKKEMAGDIWLIFTDKVTVKFIKKDGKVEQIQGRWCSLCK